MVWSLMTAMPETVGTVPMASASVDRLEQVPDRLRLLFEYEPVPALSRSGIRDEVASPEARRVIQALAADLAAEPPLLDRQAFRAAAERVRNPAASTRPKGVTRGQAVEAVRAHGSKKAAAAALGVTFSTVAWHLKQASKEGHS